MARQAEMRTEGHWRWDLEPDLPLPVENVDWIGRDAFVEALASVEAGATALRTKGVSPCRCCGCGNGSVEFRKDGWRWPEGFVHYVRDHGVRPTPDFEAFVLANLN